MEELLAWMGDERLPEPGQVDAVVRYLEIDADYYRGLACGVRCARPSTTATGRRHAPPDRGDSDRRGLTVRT